MRVLYFTERDTPHDQRFLRALSGTHHKVLALRQKECLPDTPTGVTELPWPEGRPDWTDWRSWQAGADKLADLLDSVQPDLIHAGPIQGPALLAALAGFHPLVTMSWGSDLLLRAERSPWMRHATRYTLDRTDIFLADCQAVANQAVRFGFNARRMAIFPWGVDLGHFSPENGRKDAQALRARLGWADHFVVMCNRTWDRLYGVDVLAKAFVRASQQEPALRLLLAGDGPLSAQIKDLLNPVRGKVHFPGWLDRAELPGAYCGGNLYVSPSHCDGSSVSLLEALACGRPALVSDIPSNREWIIPGEAGELFKDGDVDSLVTQLLAIAARHDLAGYGKRARVLAESRADWEQNFQICLAAYQQAAVFG
jgi:glycosyltransferase involved in cell wall biosynthesis